MVIRVTLRGDQSHFEENRNQAYLLEMWIKCFWLIIKKQNVITLVLLWDIICSFELALLPLSQIVTKKVIKEHKNR